MKTRLFIEQKLSEGAEVAVEGKAAHYLLDVLRLGVGAQVWCFDGASGEFACEIIRAGKRDLTLAAGRRTMAFEPSPDVWLLFAPIKKDGTDFIVQKATELGARRLVPVVTKHTVAAPGAMNAERIRLQAIEAAEQCRRVDVPEVLAPRKLAEVLSDWDASRVLFFMDEAMAPAGCLPVLQAEKGKPAAILVGPEGGFADEEAEALRKLEFVRPLSLGRRILRAETAAAAALACWNAVDCCNSPPTEGWTG